MKKILSVILTFVLLFTISVPVFAAADSSAVSLTAEAEDNGSFFKTAASEIKEFFNRIGAFFRELFGNKPLDVPVEPPETITSPDGSEMHLV